MSQRDKDTLVHIKGIINAKGFYDCELVIEGEENVSYMKAKLP